MSNTALCTTLRFLIFKFLNNFSKKELHMYMYMPEIDTCQYNSNISEDVANAWIKFQSNRTLHTINLL